MAYIHYPHAGRTPPASPSQIPASPPTRSVSSSRRSSSMAATGSQRSLPNPSRQSATLPFQRMKSLSQVPLSVPGSVSSSSTRTSVKTTTQKFPQIPSRGPVTTGTLNQLKQKASKRMNTLSEVAMLSMKPLPQVMSSVAERRRVRRANRTTQQT